MVWHVAEWAGTVLAAGVAAGLVVAAAGAVAMWVVWRELRRSGAARRVQGTRRARASS
jgi:hypothetical protein